MQSNYEQKNPTKNCFGLFVGFTKVYDIVCFIPFKALPIFVSFKVIPDSKKITDLGKMSSFLSLLIQHSLM